MRGRTSVCQLGAGVGQVEGNSNCGHCPGSGPASTSASPPLKLLVEPLEHAATTRKVAAAPATVDPNHSFVIMVSPLLQGAPQGLGLREARGSAGKQVVQSVSHERRGAFAQV